ncbi:hypothetical protein FV232_00980 [Methylobacterium sp. WL30]|uniref:hypothetical protein n=1 Tax=unclassified Methylobacterium TaxID=2615210 RepID=UPI0011CCA6B5|nr:MULTISPECIES: hypothetical protein [unclassified Methylobacterium]TXN38971.1 hypothetical protein FV225_11620 [Methylobacterium sp. WL93]TXN52258.1 hypothetical protein FV227_04190 [Methylobacterium sp. WL119]TXN70659.1 hypothetical protein FV232_00980 [Methylobacterium sp. WL30]
MSEAFPDWIADQARAERDMVDRFHDLDAVLLRVDGYARDADERAALLDRLTNASGAARRVEAADLRQLIAIAAHHFANLDRVHLIEEPALSRKSRFREERA